jgi:hypothetical protein
MPEVQVQKQVPPTAEHIHGTRAIFMSPDLAGRKTSSDDIILERQAQRPIYPHGEDTCARLISPSPALG